MKALSRPVLWIVLTLNYLPAAHAMGAVPPTDTPAPSCIQERWIPEGRDTFALSECLPGKPLQRYWTTHVFPKMGPQEWKVEVWQGSYGLTALVTDYYTREVRDTCKGVLIDSRRIEVPQRRYLEFNVYNPNLHESVEASYQLVPMIEEEARAALEDARLSCLAWKPL